MPPLIRSFLAVPAGGQLTAALSRRLDALRGAAPVRWTRPETWHLTLQFLGDWPQDRLEALAAALPRAAERAPWTLRPAGLGAFPDLRRPRVLFLQLTDDGEAADLARDIRSLTAAVWPDGPQDGRRFRAHLTVARVRGELEPDAVKALMEADLEGLPPLPVDEIRLLASELRPEGPRYRILASRALRKKGE